MKHAYIHIGAPKTGTSSIQGFLYHQRRKLARHNHLVLCPLSNRNIHFTLAVPCYDQYRADGPCIALGLKSENEWRAFSNHVVETVKKIITNAPQKNVIISSEVFEAGFITNSEISRLKKILSDAGCSTFSIILYIRDPAELANSHYSTELAQWGSLANEPPAPTEGYMQHICHYQNRITQWSDVFGCDALQVRLFEDACKHPQSIIGDFFSLIKSLTHPLHIPNQKKNPSISALGLEIVKQFNILEPYNKNGKANPLRTGLGPYIRKHYPGETYQMPEALFADYDATFAESNEWVRAKYFPNKTFLFSRKNKTPTQRMLTDEQALLLAKKAIKKLQMKLRLRVLRKRFSSLFKVADY